MAVAGLLLELVQFSNHHNYQALGSNFGLSIATLCDTSCIILPKPAYYMPNSVIFIVDNYSQDFPKPGKINDYQLLVLL